MRQLSTAIVCASVCSLVTQKVVKGGGSGFAT
jgi:hypothetical protein